MITTILIIQWWNLSFNNGYINFISIALFLLPLRLETKEKRLRANAIGRHAAKIFSGNCVCGRLKDNVTRWAKCGIQVVAAAFGILWSCIRYVYDLLSDNHPLRLQLFGFRRPPTNSASRQSVPVSFQPPNTMTIYDRDRDRPSLRPWVTVIV